MEDKLKIFSIASGSHGNSTFVSYNKTSILIDAGVSFERIKKTLELRGESIDSVCAILLTHEHSDHVSGLTTFVKNFPNIKIYAHEEVCVFLKYHKPCIKNNLVEISMPVFYIGDLTINAFNLPHDSVACFGYCIMAEDKKFSIATDLGVISDEVIETIADSNVIFLESNHSLRKMKECSVYSYFLKERILGENGHLSNKTCAETMAKIVLNRDKQGEDRPLFVLCHQSKNTNSAEIVVDEVGKILMENNIEMSFVIASQENGTDVILV